MKQQYADCKQQPVCLKEIDKQKNKIGNAEAFQKKQCKIKDFFMSGKTAKQKQDRKNAVGCNNGNDLPTGNKTGKLLQGRQRDAGQTALKGRKQYTAYAAKQHCRQQENSGAFFGVNLVKE